MTESKDGGPAFPRITYEGNLGHPGMSLRDWFAGQALAGAIASPRPFMLRDKNCDTAPKLADLSYEMADAMIRARNEGESE